MYLRKSSNIKVEAFEREKYYGADTDTEGLCKHIINMYKACSTVRDNRSCVLQSLRSGIPEVPLILAKVYFDVHCCLARARGFVPESRRQHCLISKCCVSEVSS